MPLTFSIIGDILAETMFDAIWPDTILRIKMKYDSDTRPCLNEPVYELGDILDYGMAYMENVGMSHTYGNNLGYVLYTREIYHLFGDPSMMIYTSKPTYFNNPSVTYDGGVIKVNSFCSGTKISFYTPSETSPIVDSYIGNYVEYPTNADSVIICIDKHNCVPYIHTVHNTSYIQNETINGNHTYVGGNILIGNSVTSIKPFGDVLLENGNITIKGTNVTLHPGTTITDANVKIN